MQRWSDYFKENRCGFMEKILDLLRLPSESTHLKEHIKYPEAPIKRYKLSKENSKSFIEFLTQDICVEDVIEIASHSNNISKVNADSLIISIYHDNNKLYSITGWEFEGIVRQLLTLWDFHAIPTPKTRDGGVDMLAFKNESVPLCAAVECKTAKKHKSIGVNVIRSVMYVADKIKASCAFIFTNAKFSKDSHKEEASQQYRLKLHDGKSVLKMVGDYVLSFFPQLAF